MLGPELNFVKLENAIVSFTDLANRTSCGFTSVPARFRKGPTNKADVPTRPQVMGQFFHRLIEGISRAAALEYREAHIKLHEQHLEPIRDFEKEFSSKFPEDMIPISEWDMSPVFKKAEEILRSQLKWQHEVKREEHLSHSNGFIHGTVDEFSIEPDQISIVEYKLKKKKSEILTDRNVKQLHFYASLVKDKFPGKRIKLELVGLGDVLEEVRLDEKLRVSLLEDATSFAQCLRKIGKELIPPNCLCAGCEQCEPKESEEGVAN